MLVLERFETENIVIRERKPGPKHSSGLPF